MERGVLGAMRVGFGVDVGYNVKFSVCCESSQIIFGPYIVKYSSRIAQSLLDSWFYKGMNQESS